MSTSNLFPETLRIAGELDWVYTSSRKVARYLDMPHHEVVKRIDKLNKDMVALEKKSVSDDKWGRGMFRLGVLKHACEEQAGEGVSEWLLSRDSFLMLVMNLDGKAATKAQHRMIEHYQQMQREIVRLDRLKTQPHAIRVKGTLQ